MKNYVYEIWKPATGFEGLYEVSNFGRVKRLVGDNCRTERKLKPVKNENGYLKVVLCKNGKQTVKLLHRLVAETFIPNPENLPQVNHKSEIKTKNFVWQLEWCTAKYNSNYGTRVERMSNKQLNNKFSKPVLQYESNGNLINEYPSIKEVERQLGYPNAHISACCSGKQKTAYNYIWKYK